MKFDLAKPIFLKNKGALLNVHAGFQCVFHAEEDREYILKITGGTLYAIYLNGEFIFYGPARAAHGYHRVDELPLKIKTGQNILAVSVNGYNCDTFYIRNMKPFVQAEILENGCVKAYTGRDFAGRDLDGLRERRAFRYSYQRGFTEAWNFDNGDALTNWKTEAFESEPLIEVWYSEELQSRGFTNPIFKMDYSGKEIEHGAFRPQSGFGSYGKRFISNRNSITAGFKVGEITSKTLEAVHGDFWPDRKKELTNNRYVYYKFNQVNSGFIRTRLLAKQDSEVYLLFSEKMENGLIHTGIYEGNYLNVIKYTFKQSEIPYEVQNFEAYSFRYVGVLVRAGEIELQEIGICEYSYPVFENVTFTCADKDLEAIFKGAQETFRQNTVDGFMDCPGRERACWLCDSYFTGKASLYFTGDNKVEELFLKNFVQAREFPGIPEGMLPYIYPAGITENNYISQWAMWYAAEVADYIDYSSDDKEYFRGIIYDLLAYFSKFENEDHLLVRLGHDFIEWSLANEFVKLVDISYAGNMVYYFMLTKLGQLYQDKSLLQKAESIKKAILRDGFDGEFFYDGAKLNADGTAVRAEYISEACQYYALYTGMAEEADPRFEKFYELIYHVYGHERKRKGQMPEVAFAAGFIGFTLRKASLLKLGKIDMLLAEMKDYYLPMAERTGTFWESDNDKISMNHGFNSYAAVMLIQGLTGLKLWNPVEKKLVMKPQKALVDFSIIMKTEFGPIIFRSEGDSIKVEAPTEYTVIYEA